MSLGNQTLTQTPLSPAELTWWDALTGWAPGENQDTAASPWTPALAPVPGPGSSPGSVDEVVPPAPGAHASGVAKFELPDLPACQGAFDVTIEATVSVDGDPSDTGDSGNFGYSSIGLIDPTVPAFGGLYAATQAVWNLPGDHGGPAQTITATFSGITPAQWATAALWLHSEASSNTTPRTHTWSDVRVTIDTEDTSGCPVSAITVAPTAVAVGAGCVCEVETFEITNNSGAALDGHLLSLSTPADWSTRAASMTYSGGASGIANAPGASFVVSTWPDGGVVTLACELCPGCSDDGVYSVTVDVTSPVGALVASEPVTVGRGVPAPPIAPIAPRVAAPQAAPAKAAAKTTAKRKATK